MINSRFNGEYRTGDVGGEKRHVLILSPYLQTSETNIDYDSALIVDLQSIENEMKVQIEEMMKNVESNACKTFLEYSQFAQFRDGTNVMQWLQQSGAIQKVPASSVEIVMGQNRFPLSDVNAEIKRNDPNASTQSVAEEFTDPSMNRDNVRPALVEGGDRRDYERRNKTMENPTPVNESVDNVNEDVPSEVSHLPVMDEDQFTQQTSQPVDQGQAVQSQELTKMLVEMQERVEKLDKKVTNSSNKETVVMRLMKKYDLTEQEAVKALESAGERKRKKLEKEKEKHQKQK